MKNQKRNLDKKTLTTHHVKRLRYFIIVLMIMLTWTSCFTRMPPAWLSSGRAGSVEPVGPGSPGAGPTAVGASYAAAVAAVAAASGAGRARGTNGSLGRTH